MDWRQFVMHLNALNPDTVEEIFTRFGASSVTLADAEDEPILEPAAGEMPLWTNTQIIGLFATDADFEQLEKALLTELQLTVLPTHRIDELAEREWEREWLRDFGPMQFGQHLWIHPTHWPPARENAVVVRLDPGLAFGTGTHATTALCLEWLDGLSLNGKTMLDYGCGSGVLAIAALKLGCDRATAMDIDLQAVTASRQNAIDNDVAEQLHVVSSADQIDGRFDVVVANILAGPLVQFAESITLNVRGRGMLALSGVLCEQADDVMAAYAPWIEFDEPVFRTQDGQIWTRLAGKRRGS